MPLLDSHLEQISSSARTIGDAEFPPSKIFTNALLGNHEITTLIRDTEPHERSLFSLDPGVGRDRTSNGESSTNGVYSATKAQSRKSIYATAPPVQQSAVARVLGPEMLSEIRQSTRGRGVNVEVLLRGAEKLCEAYAVAGVPEKIMALRRRHQHTAASVEEYEDKVLNQQTNLNRLHTGSGYGLAEDDEGATPPPVSTKPSAFSQQDLEAVEAEVVDLEARKRALEERVAGMEADLGGLLREA